jgi:Meiotically up-regulated gene 113
VEKDFILGEIRRTAIGGKPLGRDQFCSQTGIREHDWLGRYWAKWSDAQVEAGFEPLTFNAKFDDEHILGRVADLTMKLGKFPTVPEMRLERRTNPDFPNDRAIGRRWDRGALVGRLLQFCNSNAEYAEIIPILRSTYRKPEEPKAEVEKPLPEGGYVYLIGAQSAFKIGCTRAPYRRAAEIANQSASGAELLHLISTDDPEGIEKYWHNRFSEKRLNGVNKQSGEWFALTGEDLRAFKKRKFM